MAGGLRRAEVRAVGERRQHVAQQRASELWIRAGRGPEPPPPLKPVRGPGEDLKQRPIRHPLLQLLLQRGHARVGVLRPSAFEGRDAGRGVDHEIGVLGVLGIDGGGLLGELRPQLIGERLGAGRQAGLCAELVEQPFAVLPRQQLRGPVRVCLRPSDCDISGPQLRGEIREHACLEVAAVKTPGMITV